MSNIIRLRIAVISNLEAAMPAGESIGRAVRLVYATMPDGVILPRWTFA